MRSRRHWWSLHDDYFGDGMSECINKNCQCAEGGGWCERHKMKKTKREVELCKGIAKSPDSGKKYWIAWEQGKIGATAPENPILKPEGFCNQGIGLGDTVKGMISAASLGMIQPCGGCKDRAALLNHIAPADLPPVDEVEFDSSLNRNLLMHVWPSMNGSWRWNCDQVMQRAELFNGRRIVTVATDQNSEQLEAVQKYMQGFTDEFIHATNDPRGREVATFIPMLEKLESLDLNEVTFFCHNKGARHAGIIDNPNSTIQLWAEAMYETCLDYWSDVESILKAKAMAGSFKRYGQFTTKGNHRWHYSGTFYWFRNRDVFSRNWRYIDRQFFGVESWPGHMFLPSETGCIFHDNTEDLYQLHYWNDTVKPALEKWKNERSVPQA